MHRSLPWTLAALALAATPLGACGGDDGDTLPPLFEPKPECMGDALGAARSELGADGFGACA